MPIDPCEQNKERIYGLLYPPKIARTDLKKFVNDCVSRNGCRINTTEPDHMILVSFFSEDNVLSYEIKIRYIFEFQSDENRAFRFFFWTPDINNFYVIM